MTSQGHARVDAPAHPESSPAPEGLAHQAALTAKPESGIPPVVREVLASPGQPLDPETRAVMEPRFGHDFSQVRVHTDGKAAESMRVVGARAYTVGHDLVFDRDNYHPGTRDGQQVLAHELAHVVQQGRGGAAPTLDPGSFLEQAADQAANRVVHGMEVVDVPGASGLGIARQVADPAAEAHRVQALRDDLKDAIDKGDWGRAAEILNAFNILDIHAILSGLKKGQIGAIYAGAIANPIVGPDSNVAKETRVAYLDLNYENAIKTRGWADAAKFLNAFNATDISDRLMKLDFSTVQAIHTGALQAPEVGTQSQVAVITGRMISEHLVASDIQGSGTTPLTQVSVPPVGKTATQAQSGQVTKSDSPMPATGDAFKGIELYLLVETVPSTDSAEIKYHREPYQIAAQIRNTGTDRAVAYYIAWRTDEKRNEYIIGPDKINDFLNNVNGYASAGDIFYMNGTPTQYDVESARSFNAVLEGRFSDAWHSGKAAWKAAVKDPSYWLYVATIAAGEISAGKSPKMNEPVVSNGMIEEGSTATRPATTLNEPISHPVVGSAETHTPPPKSVTTSMDLGESNVKNTTGADKPVDLPAQNQPEPLKGTAKPKTKIEVSKPLENPYDAEAWNKYYAENPTAKRSVGAAGMDDPTVFGDVGIGDLEEGVNVPPETPPVGVDPKTAGFASERNVLDTMGYERPKEHNFPGIDGWKKGSGREMTVGGKRIIVNPDEVIQLKAGSSANPNTIEDNVTEAIKRLEPNEFENKAHTLKVANPKLRVIEYEFQEGVLPEVGPETRDLLTRLSMKAGQAGIEIRWYRISAGQKIRIPIP